jgi:hypothetical protein
VRSTPSTTKGTKAPRIESACNKKHQNKEPRPGNEGPGGEESKQVRKGSEEKGGGQEGFVVDLELMSASMKKKGSGTQAATKGGSREDKGG